MVDDLIERIRGRCRRLVEIAPWWSGRWRPLDERSIRDFELRHAVRLPDGYRRLLLEVGDRAPLPGHPLGRLLALSVARQDPLVRDWLGPLNAAFAGAGSDPIELEWDDETDELVNPTPLAGCLPIADRGCDSTSLLVVTGRDRGRVWICSPSGAPQLRPTGAEFLDWYLAELERGLAPLETDAAELADLEQRVAVHPDELEPAVALGRRLVLLDRPRARALLEHAWLERQRLDAASQTILRRAIAELDLVDHRPDRIESFADDDDWLRSYAGIAAARAGDYRRAIACIDPAAVPVLLRAPAIGWLARAYAASGDRARALELLRSTQASASNHALAAQLRASLGEREAALRSWREALATSTADRAPRPPSLAERIEIPVPDSEAIEAAIAELERGA